MNTQGHKETDQERKKKNTITWSLGFDNLKRNSSNPKLSLSLSEKEEIPRSKKRKSNKGDNEEEEN